MNRKLIENLKQNTLNIIFMFFLVRVDSQYVVVEFVFAANAIAVAAVEYCCNSNLVFSSHRFLNSLDLFICVIVTKVFVCVLNLKYSLF